MQKCRPPCNLVFSHLQDLKYILSPVNEKTQDNIWKNRMRNLHSRRPPSFFCTSTMALHQVLWLGLMAPDSNISLRWFLTSSTIGGGFHLNHSLKGVLSVTFIVCSVEWMQPNSARSNENTSWYLARSRWAASINSGAHELRPLKSSSSNSLPCLCLTVNFGVWRLGCISSLSWKLLDLGGSGTGNVATTLAMGNFFQRVWE